MKYSKQTTPKPQKALSKITQFLQKLLFPGLWQNGLLRKTVYRVAQKTGLLCYIASNFRNTA